MKANARKILLLCALMGAFIIVLAIGVKLAGMDSMGLTQTGGNSFTGCSLVADKYADPNAFSLNHY